MAGPDAATSSWLRDERTEIAAERILDAAAELFVVRGVASTGMAEIAKAAGCSRATLYRYFENRRALHLAFVHREARRLGERLGKQVAVLEDPRRRVVEGILGALREVRATPILAAWFGLGDAAIASEIANTSEVIEVLGAELLADAGTIDQQELSRRARWLVRVIVSLLTVPGADEADERAMIEQFVVPALLAPF
ncbi:TetR/AcrR family transcriptional regulator [Rhodococcus sp. PAMC28707]|uniref:TetR/AcrR family transcriptional regulator n=1 Tax=unclassified Rhodococcus (in: high G+C Gram-positive bacteria) TaxID=192944 RepID=UPI00109DBF0D|nr:MULTISPECIES: TetR/AcrR family transcriptional regulator [unclassified Rhodococcus (in: high G+C Gram-positive bacteria)]QCB52044.1 TetR/AcrR family transcriptional regulator [Rhodococcus sp. PAMC28705]QCB59788.1 TetR/AcrR family transcriptional regulator [Rhodococcus sp. PAMC28707]